MKRAAFLPFILGVLVATAGRADASQYTFSFSFSVTTNVENVTGGGLLSAQSLGGGVYLAVSGTGTSPQLGDFALLPPVATYRNPGSGTDIFGTDNLLYPNSDPLISGNSTLR